MAEDTTITVAPRMVRPEDGLGLPIPDKHKVVKKKKSGKRSNKNKGHAATVQESPPGTVTFNPDVGASLTVMLYESTPVLTDGWSQWEVVDRPRRTGMTRFKGKNPYKQDISIMFDGWIEEEPQETNISTLMKMTHAPHVLAEPPKITLSGQAHKKDLIW